MGAFHIADAYLKLIGFSLCFRPSHIGHPLPQELDHKWPPAFDVVRVDCKELGNSRGQALQSNQSFPALKKSKGNTGLAALIPR